MEYLLSLPVLATGRLLLSLIPLPVVDSLWYDHQLNSPLTSYIRRTHHSFTAYELIVMDSVTNERTVQ